MTAPLLEHGWQRFTSEAALLNWARVARRVAMERVRDPQEQEWLRCGGTWFVGVDTLPNDPQGGLEGTPPFAGAARSLAEGLYGDLPLHLGQVSVIYPGYPKPYDGETEAAFGYRLRRDAAHVDGLLPVGEARRRYLMERHAYILGLPLTTCSDGASPITVWEGSHIVMRRAFDAALGNVPSARWAEVDLTEIYQAARREVFETCKRRAIPAQPGEAYVVHRLALHGVAPWADDAQAPPEGRMIVYFRPEWPGAGHAWLTAP